MDAVKYVKARYRELSYFQTIVYLFEHTEDVTFKASIATFITTVCNTPPTIGKLIDVSCVYYVDDTNFRVESRRSESFLPS